MESLSKEKLLEIVAKNEKKLKRPVLKWLDESKYPPLYWKDGTELALNEIRFLFQQQKSNTVVSPTETTLPFYALIDQERSGDFALFLLEELQKNGSFYAKNRPTFVPLAMLGDDRVIPAVKQFIISKNNPSAPPILGLLGSMGAARALSEILQAFKTKYPNVKEAAHNAFGQIAAKMSLSRYDLQDEMIPDFGFKGLFYEFSVGNDAFQAFVTEKGGLNFIDKSSGKVRKSVPAKATPEVKTHLKSVSKGMKAMMKLQKINLEHFMIVGRRWDLGRWRKHFLGKPVPFTLAQGLVWGIYNEENKLTNTFTLLEDQELEDVNLESVTINENERLGILHPLELSFEERNEWLENLVEAEVVPPFEQLNRPVFEIGKQSKSDKFLGKYENKSTSGFTNKAKRRSWRRGSVVDAGMISGYFKEFPEAAVDAFVLLDGLGVGYYGETVTIIRAFFVHHKSVRTGSYTYDEPTRATDDRLLKLGEVPPIVYSEVIADLELFIF